MITSDKSHSSIVTTAKKVSESIVISSYEKNKKQGKNLCFMAIIIAIDEFTVS